MKARSSEREIIRRALHRAIRDAYDIAEAHGNRGPEAVRQGRAIADFAWVLRRRYGEDSQLPYDGQMLPTADAS